MFRGLETCLAVLTRCEVEGYRSIRQLTFDPQPVNVIAGPNGCGKTNLYRCLYLLQRAADGRLARTLAEEGGMPSVVWAGARQNKKPVRVTIAIELDDFGYELSFGLRPHTPGDTSYFVLDPHIKAESIAFGGGKRKVTLLERTNDAVWVRDLEGRRVTYALPLENGESVLSQIREPDRYPEMAVLRQMLLGWRFYHQFRTDASSPLRHPQVSTLTPVLAHDGSDLAAALRTIQESGDDVALDRAIAEAFPGATLNVVQHSDSRLQVSLHMKDFKRPFLAPELSDGTLHYLCLLAALLTPRPPSLLAINEPEGSIHPDLYRPLATLIGNAARYSQIWITTHSTTLARFIEERCATSSIHLEKTDGETRIARS